MTRKNLGSLANTDIRRDHKTDQIDSTHEVSSDGRTVWVNGPVLLARFCPVSREFQPSMEQFWCEQHHDMAPTEVDWQDFVDRVKSLFNVTISDHHRPIYLGGPDA